MATIKKPPTHQFVVGLAERTPPTPDELREMQHEVTSSGSPDIVALATLTDELTGRLEVIEHLLVDLQLGVERTVELEFDPTRPITLKFGKAGPAWGLWIVDGGNSHSPLLKASKAHRVAAAEAMPALVKALTSEIAMQLQRMRRANAILDDVHTDLFQLHVKLKGGAK